MTLTLSTDTPCAVSRNYFDKGK